MEVVEGGGGHKEDQPDALRRYRICEITEPGPKGGRPRRIELMSFDELSEEDVSRLRRFHEPRLKARQVAELDGRIVARGANITPGDVEDSEPAPSASTVRLDSPFEVAEFARRMTWDTVERDIEACRVIRAEAHELNRQMLEQGKQMLEMLELIKGVAQKQPPPPPPVPQGRPLTLDDISKLIEVGARAVGEIVKPRS